MYKTQDLKCGTTHGDPTLRFLYSKRLWLTKQHSWISACYMNIQAKSDAQNLHEKAKNKTKTSGVVTHACGTSSREVKTGSSWAIMTSQPGVMGRLRPVKKPCLYKERGQFNSSR